MNSTLNIRRLAYALVIVVILMLGNVNAQTIPNAGFENWTADIFGVDKLDDWWINAFAPFPYVFKDSGAYEGNYCIYLDASGDGWTRFATSIHPTNLSAYVKFGFVPIVPDSAYIRVSIYDGGLIVDSGEVKIDTAVSTWTLVNAPITQSSANVDSIEIRIDGGKAISSFYVDKLEFTSVPTSVESMMREFQLVPNPLVNSSKLSFDNQKRQTHTLTIYDSHGRLARQITDIKENHILIRKGDLTSGLYFIELRQANLRVLETILLVQ